MEDLKKANPNFDPELDKKIEEKENEISAIEKEMKKLDEEKTKLDESIKNRNQSIEKAKTEKEEFNNELKLIEKNIASKEAEIQSLQEAVEATKADEERQKQANQEGQDDSSLGNPAVAKAKYEQDLVTAREGLKELQGKKKNLESKISQQDMALAAYNQQNGVDQGKLVGIGEQLRLKKVALGKINQAKDELEKQKNQDPTGEETKEKIKKLEGQISEKEKLSLIHI